MQTISIQNFKNKGQLAEQSKPLKKPSAKFNGELPLNYHSVAKEKRSLIEFGQKRRELAVTG